MIILNCMSEVSREDKLKNKYVKGNIKVASIVDKGKENRLR